MEAFFCIFLVFFYSFFFIYLLFLKKLPKNSSLFCKKTAIFNLHGSIQVLTA